MNQSKAAMAAMNKMKGAQIQSKDSFLYGRFECMMRPAYGSGVVSSFFTFYDGKDFPKNWNEIDFEFLGKNTNQVDSNVIRTIGGYTDRNVLTAKHVLNKRDEDLFWKLCIDWNPERIIWKVNDIPVRTWVGNLKQPQKIMMNVWVSDNPNWAGLFNSGLLPQQCEYKYVRYTSLDGRAWQDDFATLDLNRWQIADWMIDGTQFVKENVSISGGVTAQRSETNLILKLT